MKSEYLTFCEKCGRKLPNNYQEWKKVNPGQSFDEYKKNVCANSESIEKLNELSPKKRRITPVKIIVLVVIAIAISFSFYWGNNQGRQFAEKIMDWGIRNMSFKSSNVDEWKVFTFEDASFEMKFPDEPVKQVQNQETPAGPLEIVIYLYEPKLGKDDNLAYGIAYSSYSEELIHSEFSNKEHIDNFFDHTIQGTAKGVNGILISIEPITYGLFPGREFKVDFQNGMAEIKYRYYLVRNTLYMLQVITASQNLENTSIDYFFNTFKLKYETSIK